jgi:hypothetical protein
VKKKTRKQEEEQHEAVLHALQQKHPFYCFSSLSFSVAISGAHQQSMTTIGTPPMPLVVTLTSSKF